MNTVELASRILTQLGFYQEPSKELGVDDRRDNIVNLIEEYTHPADLTDEEIDQAITNCGYEIEETIMGKFVDIEGINMYNSLCGFARAILRKAQEK